MGKKNKKLKKKKLVVSENIVATEQSIDSSSISDTARQVKQRPVASPSTLSDESHEYDHVRKDVIKILLLMLGIVILIVVLYFIGIESNYLTSIGDWFYKILNIKTL